MTPEYKRLSEQKEELIRKVAQEEVQRVLPELRKELCTHTDEKISEEDLFSPPRYYAIRFPDEESEKSGAKVLLNRVKEFVGLRHGIFLLWETDTQLLDQAKVRYEKYEPKSSLVREIYKHFKVSEDNS